MTRLRADRVWLPMRESSFWIVRAQGVSNNCASLPGNAALKTALTQAVLVNGNVG
jgi:hypothetical protein